jgi:hypothetical protein
VVFVDVSNDAAHAVRAIRHYARRSRRHSTEGWPTSAWQDHRSRSHDRMRCDRVCTPPPGSDEYASRIYEAIDSRNRNRATASNIEHVRRLGEPVDCKGSLGIWRLQITPTEEDLEPQAHVMTGSAGDTIEAHNAGAHDDRKIHRPLHCPEA